MRSYILSIGVMTGNSIDGIDLVLTYFGHQGTIRDLCAHHLAFDKSMYRAIRALQKTVATAKGNMQQVTARFELQEETEILTLDILQDRYITQIAKAIRQLISKAKQDEALVREFDLDQIDVIGLHGQTCDHCPPSRVGKGQLDKVYTVQLGNGQQLADLTGITVIYDFRSDDIMQGGEAAPLAPIHNQHLAHTAKQMGKFPLTFCNAGNTGNLTHITLCKDSGSEVTVGWDAGPFNHYPDQLMRTFKNESCDWNGTLGKKGKVDLDLLRYLFEHAVVMTSGQNYLTKAPPKSGDPNHYQDIPLLWTDAITFEDRLRTCEYFSAYVLFHSLGFTAPNLQLPVNFALFGGGWHNPVSRQHFEGLLYGDWKHNPVLPEHQTIFETILERLRKQGKKVDVATSNAFGFDGAVMEARIFADMAKCRLTGEPFSFPDTTGVDRACVAGIIRYPDQNLAKATITFREWMRFYGTAHATLDDPSRFDDRWSRASAAWYARVRDA